MPALKLFGRAWRVSTDDFVIPGFMDVVINTVWLITSWIIFWRSDANWGDCDGGEDIRLYFQGTLAALHLSFLTSAALVFWSSKGTIMDAKPRWFVPHCLYVRLFLQAFQVGWNVLGTYWVYVDRFQCANVPETDIAVTSYIICNWILISLAVLGIYVVFDPIGSPKYIERQQDAATHAGFKEDGQNSAYLPETKNSRVWRSRLRRLTFAPFAWSNNDVAAYEQAGKLFGEMFLAEDLTPSDAITGLLLLSMQNQDANHHEKELQAVIPESRRSICIPRAPMTYSSLAELYRVDWLHPIMVSRFLRYAKATYSVALVAFDNKPKSICRLLSKSIFCRCLPGRKNSFDIIDDDYCFSCCTAGMREIAEREDETEFMHVCYTNKVFRTPFFIAKDFVTKTVIVAIRGTCSIDDIITDMVGWPEQFNCHGLPESFKGHGGMVKCAIELEQVLESNNLLGKIMSENPDFSLVFTGTSLGAGVGSMMAMFYREKYPTVKCYAYSPPGGLLSMEAAEACNDYVLSVIYGNDVVPRLSLRSIEKLKLSVIDALQDCDLPKYRIIFGSISMLRKWQHVSKKTQSKTELVKASPAIRKLSKKELLADSVTVDMTYKRDKANNELQSATKIGNNNKAVIDPKRMRMPCGEVWPPGKVLYITETPDFISGHGKRHLSINALRWRWRWAKRTDFNEIIPHPRILGDHLPYRMDKAVRVLARHETMYGPLPVE